MSTGDNVNPFMILRSQLDSDTASDSDFSDEDHRVARGRAHGCAAADHDAEEGGAAATARRAVVARLAHRLKTHSTPMVFFALFSSRFCLQTVHVLFTFILEDKSLLTKIAKECGRQLFQH